LTASLTRRHFTVILAGGVAASVPADPQTGGPPAGAVASKLTINGQTHDLLLDPRVTVLDLLREHLHLTGSKKGCDHGQCGACTVLIEGRRMNSCLALAVSHDGHQIVTIEGLGAPDHLHPMQAAFLDNDGFQCGYCTPGQICSAVGMWQESPRDLTDDEIRERMSGNICRCGAYPNIVAAVKAARPGATRQERG
jgi:xanthine dehydrogenase YagT iron-sulfur-binding subunit